jgi:multiple sugar transport system substrate-binding protein
MKILAFKLNLVYTFFIKIIRFNKEMNMKKQWIVLLIVVALLFSSMHVFGGGEAEEKDEAAETTKDVTISFWAAWGEDAGPGAWIEEFESEHPNINVKYVKFKNDDQGNVKIDVALSAGEEVDVFFNYGMKRVAPRWELCQDLTKFIERDKFDPEEELAGEHYTINGKYHALPIGAINDAVYLNKDALDEKGLKVPTEWTLEEYEEYAETLTEMEGGNKIYGSSGFNALRYWVMPARGYLGSNAFYNESGLSNFDHPAFKESLQFKYKLENIKKVQFPHSEMAATNINAFTALLQKRSYMTIASNAMSRFLSNMKDYPRDFNVTVAPMPRLKADQETNYNNGLHVFDYLAMGGNISDAKKEAGWDFMKWLATDGNINLAKVGHIPTWVKVDKSKIVDYMLGSVKDTVDIEAFKRVVLNYKAPNYADDITTAYDKIYAIYTEEAEKVLYDKISIDKALSNMKSKCDEAIKKAR